jgi:hypothetical protein
MAQSGGTANIIVRLPTERERDPEETGRLYLYLDETTIDVGTRKMFGVGALLTTVPVAPAVIDRVMDALRDDPDRDPSSPGYTVLKARLDELTLTRGHLHGSEDSGNAHSHFARAITDLVTGNFAFSFAELSPGADGAAYRQHALRSLYTLLQTRKPVACVFERRPGLDGDWGERLARGDVRQPRSVRLRPGADAVLLPAHHGRRRRQEQSGPAGRRHAPPGALLPDSKKAVWAGRCGLHKWADAAIPEAPIRWVQCIVNNRNPLFANEPDHLVAYPVAFNELTADADGLTVANCYAAAERLLRRVAVRPLPNHAEHLRPMVAEALNLI